MYVLTHSSVMFSEEEIRTEPYQVALLHFSSLSEQFDGSDGKPILV